MATEFVVDITAAEIPLKIIARGADGQPSIVFEKNYRLDLGNKDKLKEIHAMGKALSKKAESIENDADGLDAIESLARELLGTAIGGAEEIWEATQHNVYAFLAIAFHVAKTVQEEAKGNLKRYGF